MGPMKVSPLITLFFSLFLSWDAGLATPAEVLSIRGNHDIEDFSQAKRVLKKVFSGHEETLYCGCRYYGKELNLNSCGVYVPEAPKRLKRLEWEHIVPAAKFGEAIKAWKTGDQICSGGKKGSRKGRKCAERASPLFRQMEGDLYNLWPESGEINGARSNKPPREQADGRLRTFGSCLTKIGRKLFEPRKEARGIIARAYLYMNWAYDVSLSDSERRMFERWERENPPGAWECERAERIKKLQGNTNPFVTKACASK